MLWTWEVGPRLYGETVGIKSTNKFITSTSLGKITPHIRRSRPRTAGDMPGQNLTARDQCGTVAQRWGRILRKGIPASTSQDADKATSLQVGFPARSTARQARSIGRIKRWSRSIYGITPARLCPDGETSPMTTKLAEEWRPIVTIIHPPVVSRLLQPLRLMDHLARAGELLLTVPRLARPVSATS